MTGWIPDALIPSDALKGKGGFPLTVPPTKEQIYRHQNIVEMIPRKASLNQGFWIDLYLPRERKYPAGIYSSEVQIWTNGKIFSKIPVQIEIIISMVLPTLLLTGIMGQEKGLRKSYSP